jgi:hypothetical protein
MDLVEVVWIVGNKDVGTFPNDRSAHGCRESISGLVVLIAGFYVLITGQPIYGSPSFLIPAALDDAPTAERVSRGKP